MVVHEDSQRRLDHRGFLRGAACDDARELLAEYSVIADGANSTFGQPSVHTVAATFHISSQ